MSKSSGWCPPRALHVVASCLVGGALAACGGLDAGQEVFEPGVGAADERPQAFLRFPADTLQVPRAEEDLPPSFPRLLSQTGAFRDTARLLPGTGLIPYEIQAPLWSDGAIKRRWAAIPELGEVHVSDRGAWQMPEGTVFVKHFELAMDEGQPSLRRRLETRLLVAARGGAYFGVTYRWRADSSDAELVLSAQTEVLTITDENGARREQTYVYPGAQDCGICHNASAGYVLGMRTRQLNRELEYRPDFPAINQLVAWAGWGLLDRSFDNTDALLSPRLADPRDESATLQDRVRSYWDGNCSMCHAGADGTVNGWDARTITPLDLQGIDQPPRSAGPEAAALLIAPGAPEESYIYRRGATAELPLRMPPLGRNRVDSEYLDLLQRWISSL